jgi:hypothetical protein
MEPGLLYEVPFTDYSTAGLDDVFEDNDAMELSLCLIQFEGQRWRK